MKPTSPARRRPPVQIPAAAAYAGTTVRHIRRLVSERRLASYKLHGKVLISLDGVDELLAATRREAVPVPDEGIDTEAGSVPQGTTIRHRGAELRATGDVHSER